MKKDFYEKISNGPEDNSEEQLFKAFTLDEIKGWKRNNITIGLVNKLNQRYLSLIESCLNRIDDSQFLVKNLSRAKQLKEIICQMQ